MNINQTLPCPVCGSSISFSLQALIAGASFECQTCHAKIKISQSAMTDVKNIYEKLGDLKNKMQNKEARSTLTINEFIEVVDQK